MCLCTVGEDTSGRCVAVSARCLPTSTRQLELEAHIGQCNTWPSTECGSALQTRVCLSMNTVLNGINMKYVIWWHDGHSTDLCRHQNTHAASSCRARYHGNLYRAQYAAWVRALYIGTSGLYCGFDLADHHTATAWIWGYQGLACKVGGRRGTYRFAPPVLVDQKRWTITTRPSQCTAPREWHTKKFIETT